MSDIIDPEGAKQLQRIVFRPAGRPPQPSLRSQEQGPFRPDQRARTQFQVELLSLQNVQDPFPNSPASDNTVYQNCPKAELENAYEKELKGYVHNTFDAKKTDCPDGEKGSMFYGHKVHLNIEPKDVLAVSEYLKREGFRHKYLSGGEILLGKIFTVYLGSRDLAMPLALKLSADLAAFLKKPRDPLEVEYAPNVMGRFQADRVDFFTSAFIARGLSISDAWAKAHLELLRKPQLITAELRQEAFSASFKLAADKYGVYFYGNHKAS